MQPIFFLPALAAFVLLGMLIDRVSKCAWSKAQVALYWAFCITVSVAGFFILAHFNTKPDNFGAFYIELIGLAIGFRISDKIHAGFKARSQKVELAELVQHALQGEGAVNISLDVTKYGADVVENRIADLIKEGHKVTLVHQRNEGTKTLQITT